MWFVVQVILVTATSATPVPLSLLVDSVLRSPRSLLVLEMASLDTVSNLEPSDTIVSRRTPCSAGRVMLDSPLTVILRSMMSKDIKVC